MITVGERGYALRHRGTGMYLAVRWGWDVPREHGAPGERLWAVTGDPIAGGVIAARDKPQADRFLASEEWAGAADQWEIVPAACCVCCGVAVYGMHIDCDGLWRCERHKASNPCVIEGCTRTRTVKDGRYSANDVICAEHWKRYVPPRSRERRAYHAHFRRGKRHGWDDARKEAFWRFWDTLVARIRRRSTRPDFDMTEINKLFGWTDGE